MRDIIHLFVFLAVIGWWRLLFCCHELVMTLHGYCSNIAKFHLTRVRFHFVPRFYCHLEALHLCLSLPNLFFNYFSLLKISKFVFFCSLIYQLKRMLPVGILICCVPMHWSFAFICDLPTKKSTFKGGSILLHLRNPYLSRAKNVCGTVADVMESQDPDVSPQKTRPLSKLGSCHHFAS